jgi:16S rRNA (guanine966-N2)-methyltransferase
MLLHASWGGRDVIEGVRVLDAFAGTGALGLEALSRGAAHATFLEQDRAALAALHANIAACRASGCTLVLERDVLAALQGEPCGLIFVDPPYGRGLINRAVRRLHLSGWIASGGLVVAESGRDESLALDERFLADRVHGAARFSVWQAS